MSEELIVVPLDGSELSEGALPYAVALANATGCRLLLTTSWEGAAGDLAVPLPDLAQDIAAQGEAYYSEYLSKAAQHVQGVGVQTRVLLGRPVERLLHLIGEADPRYVVMATHGRSGLTRWLAGSVASKLIREATVQTLVVGPRVLDAKATEPQVRRILVPLDASELSELALDPARELAAKVDAEIVLAQVLRVAAQAFMFGVPEVDVARLDKELKAAAETYLSRARERLGPEVRVETRVLHGLPADALLDFVASENIDLVVMASHTRGGLARAFLGSVADRMIQGEAPVLLLRPEAPPAPAKEPEEKGRYCHACGRTSPYLQVTPEDRCPRCGRHLHACGNCVYFDGIACLLRRPEIHEAYPGLNCPYFQFRESPSGTTRKGPKGR